MAKSMEKTSEFLDDLTEELEGNEVAEEALDATAEFEEEATEEEAETSEEEVAEGADEETPEEPAEEPEGEEKPSETVPLATFLTEKKGHKATDARLQEMEVQNAELKGKVEVLMKGKTGTEELSPVQQAMKKQEVERIEDLDLTPGEALALQGKESEFQAKQQQQEKKAVLPENELIAAQGRALNRASVTMSDKVMGIGLGIDTITELGVPLLSQAEKVYLDHVAEEDFAKEVYRLCDMAIQHRGGPMAEALEQTKKIAQKTRPKGKRPKGTKIPSGQKRSTDDYQGPHSEVVDHIFR
jgi:hypothetical protein